jgi:hypothetical protein
MAIAPSIAADRQELLQAALAGRRPDPEVSRRVQERAAKAREEMKKRGLTNIAVELIREARDA